MWNLICLKHRHSPHSEHILMRVLLESPMEPSLLVLVNDILGWPGTNESICFIVLTSSLTPIPLMVSVLESEQHLSSGMSFVITQVTRSISSRVLDRNSSKSVCVANVQQG